MANVVPIEAERGQSAAPAAEPPPAAAFGRRLLRALRWPVSVFAINCVFTTIFLRLWVADLRLPFTHGGDELFSLMAIKDTVDHGWFLTNPDLAAPLGQHLHDFAGVNGDSFTMLVVKAFGLFTSDPALIQNLMFVLGFPTIAVITFLVLRALDVSPPPAAVIATLFALSPYHFMRGEAHFYLSLYYAVPLGGYLVLSVFGNRPLLRRRASGPRWLRWASGRTLATLAICAVVASGGIYYAIFTVLLLLTATGVRLLSTRDWRALLTGGAVLAAICVVMVCNQLPTVLYQSEHGKNDLVAQRIPYESEIFSLKFARLVLPLAGHRINGLSDLSYKYLEPFSPSSSGGEVMGFDPKHLGSSETLGLVATIGFAWLLLVLALRAAGARIAVLRDDRHGHAAVAVAVCFLLGTTGGVSALIGALISPQIRAWNRISIVIAFFSLFAVALLLDRLAHRLALRRAGALLALGLLGAILLGGLYDQTTRYFVPPYSQTKAEYGSDRSFVAAIDRQMPPRAEIFQLPYMPFPGNGPVGQMPDQDPLRPYVQSHDLRWSYAAMKGRPEDWTDDFLSITRGQLAAVSEPVSSGRPLRDDVAALVAAGFEGIYIDRGGYPDQATALEAQLRDLLGAPPLVSPNGRNTFFSLLDYRRRLAQQLDPAARRALAIATLHPLLATFGPGFYPPEPAGTGTARWALKAARLQIDNPAGRKSALFSALVTTPIQRASHVTFRMADGTVVVQPTGRSLRVRLPLRHGRNFIVVSTDAPETPSPSDPRTLFMRFKNARVVDPARTPPGLR